MVDVSKTCTTNLITTAQAIVKMQPNTLTKVRLVERFLILHWNALESSQDSLQTLSDSLC